MNEKLEDALPIGYAAVALLAGSLAYRACLTGRGFGNSPGNAWFASFGTFAMCFVLLIIIREAIPPKANAILIICLTGHGDFI